jgi:short-subunit dehydrogenase
MPTTLKTRFGPTALITGASDGIGRAFAQNLAAQGFDLVLVARRETVLQALAIQIAAAHGVKVQIIAADLSDRSAVADLLAGTADQPIGLLVAAAGFGSIGPFLKQDLASEVNMVDVNCRSIVELTRGMAARMAKTGQGGIILFGSLVGFQGVPGSATYAATKGFVQGFAEALAVELRPEGLSVLSVAPGPVGTGFAARAGMQMGRAETPETVARVALAALPGGGTVRPGFLAKLLGWSLATMPRWGRVRVLGLIMRGMTPKAKG